ncbi:MAG TPA: hypothetical protein P5149_03625 [Candidatus Competibacteraceae bacterium]|nr:hypothetical protein [Candidatus Competibacteraceae bacterium]MCP5132707.1 hypothetical protein [Gammaproteobacteria bacterium]HPF58635.1 hypothetical protein [Candidatus Competibacteraceae bacterium]HRY17471.1 hypothetical protein [Candidatus Competibacteraceae bacterium]
MSPEIENDRKRPPAWRERDGSGAVEPVQRAFLQRIIQFLQQPAPGSRLIPGTRIGEERVRQLIGFLRLRSQGSHPVAVRIRWILGQLEQTASGEEKVAGISVQQLKRLLQSIPGYESLNVAESAASDSKQRPDRLAEALPQFDSHMQAVSRTVRGMVEIIDQLTGHVQIIERELQTLNAWRAALGDHRLATPAIPTPGPKSENRPEPDVAGWFSDFID